MGICDANGVARRMETNSRVGKNAHLSERQKQMNKRTRGNHRCMLEMEPMPRGHNTPEGLPRLYPCPCLNEKRSQTQPKQLNTSQ
jgi:hypothetical protein